MTTDVPEHETTLADRFPDMLMADARPGFSGWMVDQANLLTLCQALRDELGYDYLSSVTGVDYLPEGKMEVVYQVYKTLGSPGVMFKVQVPRQDPIEIPSIISIYPGADFQEREIWDLYGIKFTDHPDLRRILMWEGFEGHPMRKDWHEPFYEEDNKPLNSRWPKGEYESGEDRNKFQDNIAYPENFNPENQTFDSETALYQAL